MSYHSLLADYRARIDRCLDELLPGEDETPQRLHQAMRYSVFNGGKRVRPLLVYLGGALVGAEEESLDIAAAAIELIHAYSLVHDDLPAMDDDDLRRGKPTCHKAFDEATAILVGDALQTLAFELLADEANAPLAAAKRLKLVDTLAHASGSGGMAGGQAIDIDAVGHQLTLEQLEQMHSYKTGALIRAAVRMGALCGEGVNQSQLEQLDHYAQAIGLAFQVQDDILDVVSDTATLGKPQGSDAEREKPTYTVLLGLDGARQKTRELHAAALGALEPFGSEAEPLRWLAGYIVERSN